MPSIADLCRWLGVTDRGGDSLTAADLRSPAAYRSALHRRLAERAPGTYSRQWHAERLSCSADTCRRYERQCGIKVTPQYHETPITWATVDQQLADEPLMGRFLMDGQRKRYPALRAIAQRLLKRKERVSLMTQGANFYGEPLLFDVAETVPASTATPATEPNRWAWVAPIIEPAQAPKPLPEPTASSTILAPIPLWTTQTTPSTQVEKGAPISTDTADHDAIYRMAGTLYDVIRGLNAARSVTHKTAYTWVQVFGVGNVQRGLAVLSKRANVRNPAGFLLSWLRSETKLDATSTRPAQRAAKTDQPAKSWIEQMRESPYAALLVNADELMAVTF